MKYRFILLIQFLLVGISSLAAQSINWLDFTELSDSLRANPKPVMVFISADWCAYCKLQSSKTFKNKQVIEALKDHYCLELNTESSEEIRFLNRTYHFIPAGVNTGTHELARLLGSINGQITLPTTVLLDDHLQPVKQEAGYLDKKYFLDFLK